MSSWQVPQKLDTHSFTRHTKVWEEKNMGSYKRIPKEIKDEILARLKGGSKVPELAKEYGVSEKSIYNWLASGVRGEISPLEYARLKRERDDLLKLVGNLTLQVEKRKKKWGDQYDPPHPINQEGNGSTIRSKS